MELETQPSGIKKEQSMKNNKGTTMVSVIISFAVLLLFVSSYFKVQKLAQNMMMTAKDTISNNRGLIKEYYLEETDVLPVSQEQSLTFSGDEGSFTIHASLNQATSPNYTGSIYFYRTTTESDE